MTNRLQQFVESNYRARAFDQMRRGQRLSPLLLIRLLLRGIFVEPCIFLIRYLPGPIGMQIRIWLARLRMRHVGKNVLIDYGTYIEGAKNISISDYVLIDRHVELIALSGEITIGRRVHIAPRAVIAGLGGVEIGDYVAIAANAQILSHSESVKQGKRMSGPMIPEEMKGMTTAKIRLEKDAVIGTGAVVLPGITVGQGAVVAANSLVIKNVKPWTIVMGVPARPVGKREPVTVPDI